MQRGTAVTIQTALVFETEDCITCGVIFALPKELRDKLREGKGQSFYCPNGHSMAYGIPSEMERLKKQLAEAERKAQWQGQLATANAARAAKAEQAMTNLQRRVSRGVCPHCQRTVAQLARHVRTKHPDVLAVRSE